jgi:hypothetical protein
MALALLAVTGSKSHRASDGLLRRPEQFSAASHKTLGAFKDLFLPLL